VETGNEWVQSYFLHGVGDDKKAQTLTYNKHKWMAIRPQVERWVKGGWLKWEREKPAWFNDNWKAAVPADWVPKEGMDGWKDACEIYESNKSVGIYGSAKYVPPKP
jgi:hypothetical protein